MVSTNPFRKSKVYCHVCRGPPRLWSLSVDTHIMNSVKVRTPHLEVHRCCVAAGDLPEPQLESIKTLSPFSEEE